VGDAVTATTLPADPAGAAALEACIADGGVALFPADTVYGLAVDPLSKSALARLNELKGRPPARPAAVLFFGLEQALSALGETGARTRTALGRLLPGPVTLLLPNPLGLFPLACGPEPGVLGIRVPDLSGFLEPLTSVAVPVLQSSANPSGGADARRLDDVDPGIRAGVDLELDGGALPGTPSTVIDLTRYETGEFRILREGAMTADIAESRLSD
jgi:L-threonylcarbamoyladenylate synthase